MTQIGPEIRQHAEVLRDITAMYTNCRGGTEDCKRQQSVSVLAQQSSTRPVLAQENFWVSHDSSENFTTTFQFVSKCTQIHPVPFTSDENKEDSSTLKFDAWLYNNRSEKSLSVGRADTKKKKKQHSRPLDEVSEWTANEVALIETSTTSNGRHGRLRACEQSFQSSRYVSILSFNSSECAPR